MTDLATSSFGEHQLRLHTDDSYRRAHGLGPLLKVHEPGTAPRIPETGEPVLEVDPHLLRQLDAWKQQRKDAARWGAELTALIDKAEAQLVEQFAAAGCNELALGDRKAKVGSTLWLKKRSEEVTAAQVAAALRADGHSELVQPEGYNASRLAGWARELEADGLPLPPHVAELLEGREHWEIRFTTSRPSRARQRQAGARSSILDAPELGASTA